MDSRVRYERDGRIATIVMDDGKANALSVGMFEDINAAFDQAEADEAVVVLRGREGRFCAGFDLAVLGAGGDEAVTMLRSGFELSHRLLSFPQPVIIACTGHAVAMGVFLLLSGDYRIGVAGSDHTISANEVAIGLTIPRAAVEICRQRLAPAHFQRAIGLAERYTPDTAVAAGFLDAVVPAADLVAAASAKAIELATTLNLTAHAASKLRVRGQALEALRAAIADDDADFKALLA
jgi:enoyl-CoA hydratase